MFKRKREVKTVIPQIIRKIKIHTPLAQRLKLCLGLRKGITSFLDPAPFIDFKIARPRLHGGAPAIPGATWGDQLVAPVGHRPVG